jgi:hypothetical protein
VRYNYEDEAQDAIDGLDGEPRKIFIRFFDILFFNEKAGAPRLIKKNRSSYNDTTHSHNRTTARRST